MKRNISLAARRIQRGQGMTEYIIIVALIAIAAIGVFTFFGGTVRGQAAGIARELSGESASEGINRAKAESGRALQEAQKDKGMGAYQNK